MAASSSVRIDDEHVHTDDELDPELLTQDFEEAQQRVLDNWRERVRGWFEDGKFDPLTAEKILRETTRRRPLNKEWLLAAVESLYGFTFSTTDVCPGHVAPGNILWDLFCDTLMYVIIIGSRESGKTLMLAIIEHLDMLFNADECFSAGAIESQAQKGYGYLAGFCRLPHFREHVDGRPLMKQTRLKNGGFAEMAPMTENRLNSPHCRVVQLDEIELTTMQRMNEAFSIPMRQKGRPSTMRLTSSRKKAYGVLEQMLEEKDKRGFAVRTFCVFEVAEQCVPERHQQGAGCRKGYCPACKDWRPADVDRCATCETVLQACPLMQDCLLPATSDTGTPTYEDGPGRLSWAKGWMLIVDVIVHMMAMDRETWESQWLCHRPMRTGLVYPMWNPEVHVFPAHEYEWNPNLEVYGGQDFGFANPGCVLAAQVLPTDELIIFDEIYLPGLVNQQWANLIKSKPWFKNLRWLAGDPAAAEGRAVMINNEIPSIQANNDIDTGISVGRWLMNPPGRMRPLLYVSDKCVNFIKEVRNYHTPDVVKDSNVNEVPRKKDDHAMDTGRYLWTQLYAHFVKV